MNLYHRTYAAGTILRDGFHDSFAYPVLDVHPGVWIYDEPLDEQHGALGDVVLEISGVPEAAILEFEWMRLERLRTFREFVVPADLLNRFPVTGIYPDTWLWINGHFDYVGAMIDMRPLLRHDPATEEPDGIEEVVGSADSISRSGYPAT